MTRSIMHEYQVPPFVSSGSNEAPGDTLFTGQAVRGPGRWDRRSWTSVQDGDWQESDPGSSWVLKQSKHLFFSDLSVLIDR